MAGGPFDTWDPLNHYVQRGLVDGRYVAGGYTMLAAGPPRLSTSFLNAAIGDSESRGSSDLVYPLGIIQNVSLQQNKQFVRIWELGSERSYQIAGRATGQLSLARIYYDGISLLRALYAYYKDESGTITVPAVFENLASYAMANPHDVIVPPGYENLFLNLASDLFNQPIGILMYVRNSNLDTLGACYFEQVTVPVHQWATDAQGMVVQESVGLQYERMKPVNVHAVTLNTGMELVAEALMNAA
jgi:hypothetical protein